MFTLDEFRESVIKGIKKITHATELEIGDDDNFADFGLDSLQGMNLVLEVEADLDIDLGEFDIDDAYTINLFFEKATKTLSEA